jgi:DNA-binding response OmpR family regulator
VKRILVAEDEASIASFLQKGLAANGFTSVVVDDGDTVAALARDETFDLVILDIGLCGPTDGLEALARIRAAGQRLPVICLTARSSTSDMVSGLDLGADDYVTKPFTFEELLARIRARLRESGTTEATVLEAAGVRLDLRSRNASVGDRTIALSAREYHLLETFLRHPGQVLSREQLLSGVWGYDFDPGSNVVDVYVGYLRKKLGSEVIETVRGMGYRLTSRAEPGSGTP